MGATYTRQSSYTDGDTITAAHTNDEFNQLLAAFAASTGHTHDGTAAEGGPITKLLGNTLTFGAATAGTDITVTFDGESNDGVLKWMEDEDYFEFSDDILVASTEKLQFRDTAIYIHSSADGQLDLIADTEIQIAATTVDINGNVDISGTLTIGGAGISEAELEILDGATVTTAEINIMDGDTSASATTVVDADRVVFNDAGTMKQVAVTDLAAYFDDEITAMPNLVTTAATTVGALNSGSITSGFGTIDTGSSTITTTGLISGGSLDIDDVLINGTTIGHTDDTDLITLSNGVVTVAGELDAVSLDISGDADIDGTLEADAITVDGTALNTVIAGVTVTNATNSAHVLVTDNESTNEENLITFVEDATSSTGNVGLEMDGNLTYNPSTGTITSTIFKGNIDAVDGDFDGTLEADAITLNGTAITTVATLSTGISNGNLPVFTSGAADNDFLRIDGTSIEGRSASEVLSDIAAAPAAGSSDIVTTGALNSGSITSGFGAIDNGASAITTTGVITGGTLEATADTSAGDNAAIGYTSAEGLILTGQGSTSDITLKNDADATVFTVPTGTDDILFPDNAKAMFGAGSDLQIYHDGSNSYISDEGTGDLNIRASDDLRLQVNSGGSWINSIICNDAAAVDLYHNNNLKLSTTSTGVAVTGNATFADNGKAIFGADSDLQIYHDNSNGYVVNNAGNLILDDRGGGGVTIKFNTDTMANFAPDGAVSLYYDNAVKLATTATGVAVTGTAVATTNTDTSNTGSVTLDFAANQNFVLTFTGNVTLANPTTEQVGQSGFIVCIQDGTGSRTLSLGTDYETAGGAGITLSSAASATDIIPYVVAASGRILLGAPQLAFS